MFRPRAGQQQEHQQLMPSISQQLKLQQLAPYQQQLQQGLLQQHSISSPAVPPMSAVPVAAAVAGAALSVILSPTELIKCRMQMAQFNSPIRCLQSVLQTEGLQGLSRGFVPTLCREVPGNAIFFTVYEGLRRSWPGRPPAGHGAQISDVSSSSSSSSGLAKAWQIAVDAGGAIICGGIAGVVMWTSVLPLDVAKTRIQTAQPGSSWDTSVPRQLVMLWREGGRRSLWAGLAPTVARAFPANACQVSSGRGWAGGTFAQRNVTCVYFATAGGTFH
eukprot:GHUV01019925.1.p1 GENE.GHUV01019925.1~~GHUV01019925.1.p1  ORF type:complete len:275 (+),score=97.41 GHUV01019925.1:108-932(+)